MALGRSSAVTEATSKRTVATSSSLRVESARVKSFHHLYHLKDRWLCQSGPDSPAETAGKCDAPYAAASAAHAGPPDDRLQPELQYLCFFRVEASALFRPIDDQLGVRSVVLQHEQVFSNGL
jgi:hypothetical protein